MRTPTWTTCTCVGCTSHLTKLNLKYLHRNPLVNELEIFALIFKVQNLNDQNKL